MLGGKSGAAVRVPAVVWTVGLVAGLFALANGYLLLAGVTLLVAVVAPWFGLGAVLHSKPRIVDSQLPWQAAHFEERAPIASGGYRIRLPAR